MTYRYVNPHKSLHDYCNTCSVDCPCECHKPSVGRITSPMKATPFNPHVIKAVFDNPDFFYLNRWMEFAATHMLRKYYS